MHGFVMNMPGFLVITSVGQAIYRLHLDLQHFLGCLRVSFQTILMHCFTPDMQETILPNEGLF